MIRIQSPCRHRPGYTSKYASRSRVPSGSFQKHTGIDGIGLVITSSPTSSSSSTPDSSTETTAAPRARQDSSPSQTGTSGAAHTKAAHKSVPPDTEQICTSGPTAEAIQRKPSGASGAPVEPTARSAARSCCRPGRRPALRQDCRYGADVPR